ncbi:hypothetical protein [Oceanirhabdus seepicola]|uniref:Uncharacterized protein n=1 Tax=Oceanirhabdus seepicola TaxID=2828781 RepID=A0A9J6P6J6_9CLOT|nr:hypothetical protein [Oceanirhabdus seepicola]MCM1991421.1 hypothetical protein [Oceanirhabdus seepicola]
MFIIVMILFIYLIIGVIEITPLYKNKEKRKLVLYSIFFSIAFVISLLLSMGVKIPNPTDGFKFIVESIIQK